MPSQRQSQPVPDAPVEVELVTDHARVLAGTAGRAVVRRALPAEVVAAVTHTATRFGVPVGVVHLAAFAVVLRKYTGESHPIVGGVPIPVRPTASFAELLHTTATASATATTATAGGAGRHTTVAGAATGAGGCHGVVAGAAVVFAVDGVGGVDGVDRGAVVRLDHDAALFDPATVAGLAEHHERALRAFTADPAMPVGTLGLASADELALVTGAFNATARPYPRDATVHGLFLERARLRPRSPALVSGSRVVDYGELADAAGALAARLVDAGARPGRPVGVLLPRGPEQVVAVLAVLMAGAAYLPIDPRYPARRVEYLLADSGARVVVTDTADPPIGTTAQLVSTLWCSDTTTYSRVGSPDDLAYVLYTSGTTGRPKGVEVPHRAVLRLVCDPDYAELTADTRILATCSPVFDVATFEVWGALLNGGCLHLVPDETVMDATALRRELERRAITTMWLTSPLFNQLVEQDPATFATLHHLLVGGEALSPRHVARAMDACPDLVLTNGYGPTENTTFSTTHRVGHDDLDRVPIGRPVANSTAYVLDPDGLPCPVGVPGELCLGGDGVARGYLGRPGLTAASFVPSTLATLAAQRLYRSGDLARWRADGVLEFFGRRDHQVKVRGYRIELGEVESALLEHAGAREAIVVVRRRPGGEPYLCAYYVADGVTPASARARLAEHLPEHMVPAHLVALDALPLNTSGKVDRTALPEPTAAVTAAAVTAAPDGRDGSDAGKRGRDDVERAVLRLAEQVLGLSGVGPAHDLRDLGADSLTAARLAAALGLRPTEVLRAGTLSALADLARAAGATGATAGHAVAAGHAVGAGHGVGAGHAVGAAGATGAVGVAGGIPAAPDGADHPLSPQQRRVHVEQLKDESAVHYNVPLRLDLPSEVDVDRLVAALHGLTARHEALRTEIVLTARGARQRVRDDVRPDVAMAAELAVRPFDLGRAPLWRAAVHRTGDGVTLLMDLHHLVVDGLSLAVLFEDLAALHDGREPAPAGVPYRDYAHWAAGRPPDPAAAAYWSGVFARPRPDTDLPVDLPRRPVRDPSAGEVTFEIDRRRTAGLRRLAREHDTTLFAVLTAAYQALLAGVSGEPDITVGVPVAGRTRPGLERTVGMFANTVCVRSLALPHLGFAELLRHVDAAVRGAIEHQDHPLEDLVPARRGFGRAPLFDALIALHSEHYLGVGFAGGRHPLRLLWNGQTPFDLNLQLYEAGDGLRASWQYADTLLLPATVARWRDLLLDLLDTVLADQDTRLERLARPAVAVRLPDFGFDL